MTQQNFRHWIQLVESLSDDDDRYQWLEQDMQEADETDQIDWDPAWSFEQVLEQLQKHENNRIGIGKYREGWHHPFDSRLVVKIATPRDKNTMQECAARNLWEFMVWTRVSSQRMPERQVLMPCYQCDPRGLWLTQFKGQRPPRDQAVPIKTKTTWIGDRKPANFAIINNQYKSIDYGSKKAIQHLGLPEPYHQARKTVADMLDQLGHDVANANYGKGQRSG